jgi:hypothetical protein
MLTFLRSKKDRFDDGIRGLLGAQSSLAVQKIVVPTIDGDMDLADIAHQVKPRQDLSADMNVWKVSNLNNINRGLTQIVKAKEFDLPTFYGSLWAQHIDISGEIIDYGLVSLRVVTSAGVNYMAAAFAGTGTVANFKYHGVGTGTGAESSSDTALGTEVETRATGTVSSSTNVYTTVGTVTATASRAITEHGIFSASTSGTLLDRSVFSVINLSTSDSIQTTYSLTLTAGG